jgi:hypothetical protein
MLWLGGLIVEAIPDVQVRVRSDIDVKKPQGKRGAKHRDRGDHPCDITIRLRIREFERDAAKQLKDLLKPASSGESRGPLSIDHPNTAFWDIFAITIKEVESPMPSSIDDWVWTVQAIEWVSETDEVGNSNAGPKQRPKDDTSDWLPFQDDGVAGSGAPSRQGAAAEGFGH